MKTHVTSLRLQANNPIKLLKLYLNLNFYLPLSPLNVSFDTASGKYQCRLVSGLSRVFIVTLQFFCPVYFLIFFASAQISRSKNDPASSVGEKVNALVGESVGLFWFLTNILVKFSLWTHACETESMLNCMLDVQRQIKELGASSRSAYKRVICIGLLYAIMATQLIGIEIYLCIEGLNSSQYSFNHNSSRCTDHGGLNLYCTGNILTNCISLVVGVLEQAVIIFAVAYVFILSVILLESTRSFERYFHEQKSDFKTVLSSCKLLIQLSSSIKRSSATITSVVSFGILLFYSHRLQSFFSLRWEEIFLFSYFIITHPIIFICGAKTNAVISGFSKTLASHAAKDDTSLPCAATSSYWERTLILHAIDTNGAGLKGRTFTATYSVLGNILGYVVTYAIAIVQFQQ